MLEKTFPNQERLLALSAFTAIAIATATAIYLLLFSGIQIDPLAVSRQPPSLAETTLPAAGDSAEGVGYKAHVVLVSPSQTAPPQPAEREILAGGVGGSDEETYVVRGEAEIYRDIAALYAERDRSVQLRLRREAVGNAIIESRTTYAMNNEAAQAVYASH